MIIKYLFCGFLFINGALFAKERLVLITGCPRSGTQYIAQVLNNCGLDIGHEVDGAAGIAFWAMASDKGLKDKPAANEYQFRHIFHQVRHPLDTISSVNTFSEVCWRFIRSNIPEISRRDSKLVRAAKFWYYWNLMAENKAEMTYRVEDIENVFDEMATRLGVQLDKSVLKKVPKNVHSRQSFFKKFISFRRYYVKKYTWADLRKELDPDLYQKIIVMTKRYGYSVQ